MPLFEYAVTLRYLLYSLFGVSAKPCNPYKDNFYNLVTDQAYFVGPMLSGGSSKVDIPPGDNPFEYPDSEGNICRLSYHEGISTHEYMIKKTNNSKNMNTPLIDKGVKKVTYLCNKECYDKAVFALKVTLANKSKGVFTFVGRKMSKNILHYNTTHDFLNCESNTLGSVWNLNSSIEGVVMGKVLFFDNLFRIMTSLCGLFVFLGLKEVRGFYILTIVLFGFIIGFSVLTMLINMFENNNEMKISFYKYRITRYLKCIEYSRNILDSQKYCCETAGHPLKCVKGDTYFALEDWDLGFESYFEGTKANLKYNPSVKASVIKDQKDKYCSNISERLEGNINNCFFSLENYNRFSTGSYSEGVNHGELNGLLRVSIEFSSTSVFSNKRIRFEKMMEKKSYITLFKMLKEMSDLNNSILKPKYFKRWNIDDEGDLRHSSEIKEIIEELSSGPKYAVYKQITLDECWVLGYGFRDLSNFELEILEEHNKRFFGGNGKLKILKILETKSFFFTPSDIGNSQWKKYQHDVKYLFQNFDLSCQIKTDKKYKKSSWIQEFIEDHDIKVKLAFSKVSKKGKSPLINKLIEESIPEIVKTVKETFPEIKKEKYKGEEIVRSHLSEGIFKRHPEEIRNLISELGNKKNKLKIINEEIIESERYAENHSHRVEKKEEVEKLEKTFRNKRILEILNKIESDKKMNIIRRDKLKDVEKVNSIFSIASRYEVATMNRAYHARYELQMNEIQLSKFPKNLEVLIEKGLVCFDRPEETIRRLVSLSMEWINHLFKIDIKDNLTKFLEMINEGRPILIELKDFDEKLSNEFISIAERYKIEIKNELENLDRIESKTVDEIMEECKTISSRFCISNNLMNDFDNLEFDSGRGNKKRKKRKTNEKKKRTGKGLDYNGNKEKKVINLLKNNKGKRLLKEEEIIRLFLVSVIFGNLHQSKRKLYRLLDNDIDYELDENMETKLKDKSINKSFRKKIANFIKLSKH